MSEIKDIEKQGEVLETPVDAVDILDEAIDVITFVDDDDNEFDMQIITDFEHKGKNYVVLAELDDQECECGKPDCTCHEDDEESLYIFESTLNEQGEEDFAPIEDDDLLTELSQVVEELLAQELAGE